MAALEAGTSHGVGTAVLPPAGAKRPVPTTAQAAALAAVAAAGPGFHAFLLQGGLNQLLTGGPTGLGLEVL